ncbi:MAG: SH3 domain-containing protein, partial [Pyrinomonadaceae bacterium]
KEQIANLERMLNEQTKGKQPANLSLDLPDQNTTVTEARVNSPNDGFLALRTFPSSEAGTRILQIPHGETITVGGCLSGNKIKGKPGKWCRASYNGYSGWVFDAYLIY